jgi:hypothetical protein
MDRYGESCGPQTRRELARLLLRYCCCCCLLDVRDIRNLHVCHTSSRPTLTLFVSKCQPLSTLNPQTWANCYPLLQQIEKFKEDMRTQCFEMVLNVGVTEGTLLSGRWRQILWLHSNTHFPLNHSLFVLEALQTSPPVTCGFHVMHVICAALLGSLASCST